MSALSATVRDILHADYDPGDRWGWVQGHRFAIAAVLTFDGPGCPDAWQYRPGAATAVDTESYPDSEWRVAWLAGYVNADDLLTAGNVLARYARACERTGVSY